VNLGEQGWLLAALHLISCLVATRLRLTLVSANPNDNGGVLWSTVPCPFCTTLLPYLVYKWLFPRAFDNGTTQDASMA
jgi:hypothetical protein